MSNTDLLPSLLFKINQNQLALEAAIMELTLWVEQRGSAEVAGNDRGALDTISKNNGGRAAIRLCSDSTEQGNYNLINIQRLERLNTPWKARLRASPCSLTPSRKKLSRNSVQHKT